MKYRYLKESLWDDAKIDEDEIEGSILFENIANILNERKGVTKNSAATVDYILELLNDCIYESMPLRNFKGDYQQFSYPLKERIPDIKYRDFRKSEHRLVNNEKNYIEYQYVFEFPESATMTEWMDSDSELEIHCRYYLTAEDLFEDKYFGNIFSTHDMKNNKSVGRIVIAVSYTSPILIRQYYKNNKISKRIEYYYSVKRGFTKLRELAPYIQHEINHIHKTSIRWTDVDEEMNNQIMYQMNNPSSSNLVKTIGEFLYRYCIPTEREAYTEQFYKEYVNIFKKYNSFSSNRINRQQLVSDMKNETKQKRIEYASKTETIQIYTALSGWLNKNEIYLYEKRYASEIFYSYEEPARHFLKINEDITDSVNFCKEMIQKIKDKMLSFYDRCIKSTYASDDYPSREAPLREWIEEYRKIQY